MDILINNLEGEKRYTMPETWEEMDIKTYISVMSLLDEDDEELEQMIKLVHLITGIPKKDINSLNVNQINELKEEIDKLVSSDMNKELKHIIKIDDVEYGFNPNISEMSIGEFADIEHYLKEDIHKNLHKVLSVLYRPIKNKQGDKYSIIDYKPDKDRQELFLNRLKVGDFSGASAFFLTLGKELLINSVNSLANKRKWKLKLDLASQTL
tara:strand:- start:2514 stop:3143 length:630 start_codon:yes stop_codon:yes gene_type:complete